MADLKDYLNTNDLTEQSSIYGTTWAAQSFTASSSYSIGSIKALIFRTGSPGTITASIRATDGSGFPTGSDINSVTGTTNGNTLPTDSPYEWREITLSSPVSVTSGTKYAIVLRAADGSVSNYFSWRLNISDEYAGGTWSLSLNSGSTWGNFGDDTSDFLFEVYTGFVFQPPVDIVTYRRIVAACADKIYYEDI